MNKETEELIRRTEEQQWTRLYLSSFKFNALPDQIFKQKQLEYLDVSNNNLSQIPDSIQELVHLKVVDLSNNKIENLPVSTLLNLSSLHELRVYGNPLQGVQKKLLIKENTIQPALEETLYSCMDDDDYEEEDDNKLQTNQKIEANKMKTSPDKPSWLQELQESSDTSKIEQFKQMIQQFKSNLPQLIQKLQILRTDAQIKEIELFSEQQSIQIDPALNKDIFLSINEIQIDELISQSLLEIYIQFCNLDKDIKIHKGYYHGQQVNLTFYPQAQAVSPQFANLVTLMGTIRHPNIQLFVGISQKASQFLIAEETTCELFTLKDILYPQNQNAKKMIVDLKKSIHILSQIASALTYLNSKKIVFQNLSSQNVLIDKNFKAKLTNFQRIISLEQNQQQQLAIFADFEGNQAYLAPESLKNQKINETTDVYSFGTFIWELIQKQEPVSEAKALPPISNKTLNSLSQNCRQTNKSKRPTFLRICKELQTLE